VNTLLCRQIRRKVVLYELTERRVARVAEIGAFRIASATSSADGDSVDDAIRVSEMLATYSAVCGVGGIHCPTVRALDRLTHIPGLVAD
jgi:hypothetical protein